jgi:hypothetical protein
VHDLEAGILVWLQQRRAVTAIFVLEGLEQKYRSDWWIRKAVWEARRLLLKSTWEPLAPEVTKRVIEDREHMLVRDEAEFMEAVWEALHEFQTRIRDAGDRIRRLWNEYHIGGVMVYQPKPEEPLSREIALSLHDLLRNRGVSAHLESKIREGEYVDVLVSTVTAGSKPRPVSLIIEVKGCWNPGVRSSLRKQLAERYLKENSSGFGIYLVVQFLCEAWDQRDNREKKAWKESLSGMRTFLKAQAERVNSATQSSIRAFVLDASLPDSWSKTGHKAKKVSARKETASVKHQSSKSVRRTKKPASKR